MVQLELMAGRRMTEGQRKKHFEVCAILHDYFKASKIDAQKLSVIAHSLIEYVKKDDVAIETKVKAIDAISDMMVVSSFKPEKRLEIRSALADSVAGNPEKAVQDAFKRFKAAIEKRERVEKSQTVLDLVPQSDQANTESVQQGTDDGKRNGQQSLDSF